MTKPTFRIEVSASPRRTKDGRKQWAWHAISTRKIRGEYLRLCWSGEHNINRAHVLRMVERLFNARERGIEVMVVE